jgi:enoyl-CoA hydratase/carnithine racemase
MICSGEPAKAKRARDVGLVFDVVPSAKLIEEAVALVKWAAADGGWRR